MQLAEKSQGWLIAFTGLAGSGKTEACQALRNLSDVKVDEVSFAAPLKAMLMVYLTDAGLSQAAAWQALHGSPEDKALEHPALEGRSARYLMQTLGTEWGRQLVGPDIWINLARTRILKGLRASYDAVVIPDLRFPNELDLVHEMGGIVVRIMRDGVYPKDNHISEQVLTADFEIKNDSSLSEFHHKVQKFYQTVFDYGL